MKSSYNSIKWIVLLLPVFLVLSCDRSFKDEVIGTTPPALQVNVKSSAGAGIAGATVKVYTSEADWNAETAPVLEKQTPADGRLVLSKDELKTPGFFYLIGTKDALKTKLKTKYLLLTDGVTYQDLLLQ